VYSSKKHEELRKNRNTNSKKSSFLTAFGFERGWGFINLRSFEIIYNQKIII
jgi:hypothetical protein